MVSLRHHSHPSSGGRKASTLRSPLRRNSIGNQVARDGGWAACPRDQGLGPIEGSPVVSLRSTQPPLFRGREASTMRHPLRSWLGQRAPGTQAWDVSKALLWCRCASTTATRTRFDRPTSLGRVAGAECPRAAMLASDLSKALLWCRRAPPQPPLFRGPEASILRSPLWRNSIGNQVARRISLEPARTRPAPVAGLRHKATPDGVHVDVVDHRHQGPGFPDVPIESAT